MNLIREGIKNMKSPSIERFIQILLEQEIQREISNLKSEFGTGEIGWIKWDKDLFDKRLGDGIKKICKKEVDLEKCWEVVLKDFPEVFVKLDFMEGTFGYTYSCGGREYRGYGHVIFYSDCITTAGAEELLANWFYREFMPEYKKFRENKIYALLYKNQKLYRGWSLLYDVIRHYEINMTLKEAKEYLETLIKANCIKIYDINEYEIIF